MRNFLVAFVAKMDGILDSIDHINSVAVSHKSMPSMVTLKKQISEALVNSSIRQGYRVVGVNILAISEFSTEDITALIKDSDDIIFVEIE